MGIKEGPTHFGSDAFSLEYRRNIPRASLYKDIESYLGEYRFAVAKYEYELLYTPDEFGVFHLVSPHDREPMTVKCQRAIQKRKDLGCNTSREEAEYRCAHSLETQLSTASPGDMVFWTSPPGPPEDGYGSYGHFFVGKTSTDEKVLTNKRISITLIRIEGQSVAQCSEALTALTGNAVNFNTAEDCISNPKVMPPINGDIMRYVLTDVFHFTPDEKGEKLFADVMNKIKPQVDDFIGLIKNGASKRAIQQGFWALENYAVALRALTERHFDGITSSRLSNNIINTVPFNVLVARFGQSRPAAVAGSCGSTGRWKSSNTFNSSFSFLVNLFSPESSANFVCPNCHKESEPPVGDRCPKCGITKDEAEKKGLTTC